MKRKREAHFYSRLRGIRNEFGFSIEDMANKLNISKDCYFRKEKGKTDFYLSEVRKILELFNVNFDDIFFISNVNEKVNNQKE